MNYHNITKDDMLNGSGLRVVLWVAGCSHRCPQCQNPVTWDPDDGLPFTDMEKREIFQELEKDYVSGITFSGGDPLHISNIGETTNLAREIWERYPDKNIWLYTGYVWEQVKNLEIVKYIDVLADGRFKPWKKKPNLKWVGSSNQRVIDVKKSLERDCVVLLEH